MAYSGAQMYDYAQLSIVADLATPSLDGMLLDTIIKWFMT